jgi:hypothetical protein
MEDALMKSDNTSTKLSRRKFLERTALATTATIAFPYIRTANAAGKLTVGFWDHWVPGANDTLTKLVQEWGAKEKVEVEIDYITSQGFKLILTGQAEAQAKAGHDILAFATWDPLGHGDLLEPMDDVMKELIAANGAVNPVVEYLGKGKAGHWVAVPASPGSQIKPPCTRIDLMKQFAGIDVQAMYPAGGPANAALADKWTWDAFADAAVKCAKGGYPFGMPMGQTSDAVDWVGTVFNAYGAQLMDAKGEITVKSDATRQVLEWFKKIVPSLPPDVWAWDDAGNNKWLISGKGALIMNPPSAWAVAVRDAPKVAEQCWTHPAPAGPKGRYAPFLPFFWGNWSFSKNKSAAKSLLVHLSTRSSAEKLVAASHGYDLPAYAKLNDFKTWEEEGPPKGTLSHYPNRDGQILSVTAAPAPPDIAVQIYNQALVTKMVYKMSKENQTIEQTIAYAEKEMEGYKRG